MASVTQELERAKLIAPPRWLTSNIQYECYMGSVAYGVSSDVSDCDLYGFTIPPKEIIFPHLSGEIPGFGEQKERFDQYQKHHVKTPDGREYDVTIYSIVRYFHLCMDGNPNMVDSLFVPRHCVTFSTPLAEHVRENRRLFLSKRMWHRFKGYAYSQLNKMRNKENRQGKRVETIEQFGFDVKFAYHVVRLLYEIEMLMTEGDMDLQRHKEHLKSIRRGYVSEEEIRQWAQEKEKGLEKVYERCTLPHRPREAEIKQLLLECLEQHYGSLNDCVRTPDAAELALAEIQRIVERFQRR
jgi:predicted nucleotidyltransferase